MTINIEQLVQMFTNVSKHSSYQILASNLGEIIGNDSLRFVRSRHERERLNYITSVIDIDRKKILDIGGNTGYFSFEFLNLGAESILYYEGNRSHASFVKGASCLLNYENRLKIFNRYFLFEKELCQEIFDMALVLNVLHHLGDDYGDRSLSLQKAKDQMIVSINYLASFSKYIVLQMGFCWKGNPEQLLFKNGTKAEMINFISEGTKEFCKIIDIGIAEKKDNLIVYASRNEKNIQRDDTLGEFLNRPIFILKSLTFK